MGMEVVGTLGISGILTAVSVYIFFLFMNIRKVVGYHLWIDMIFSILMIVLYAGTFSGMITAFTGGLTLSLLLYGTKKLIGYARYYRRWGWRYFPGII